MSVDVPHRYQTSQQAESIAERLTENHHATPKYGKVHQRIQTLRLFSLYLCPLPAMAHSLLLEEDFLMMLGEIIVLTPLSLIVFSVIFA